MRGRGCKGFSIMRCNIQGPLRVRGRGLALSSRRLISGRADTATPAFPRGCDDGGVRRGAREGAGALRASVDRGGSEMRHLLGPWQKDLRRAVLLGPQTGLGPASQCGLRVGSVRARSDRLGAATVAQPLGYIRLAAAQVWPQSAACRRPAASSPAIAAARRVPDGCASSNATAGGGTAPRSGPGSSRPGHASNTVGISTTPAASILPSIMSNSVASILGTSCFSMRMFGSSTGTIGSQSKQPM